MRTFSQITIAMLTMSVAVAQPKAEKPAPPPAKDTKDAKTPVVAPPREKAAPPTAMPTVPNELIELAKVHSGTWKCKGESFERDGSKTPITATNKVKADLDKWWIAETLEVKGMKMGAFKMTTYTTFDAASKKWRRIGLDNWGSQMVGTADAAPVGQPMVFNLDSLGPLGAGQFRDHSDPSDPKAGLKVWGEMSSDKGKTWNKAYEMVCKK
jgi:hypothetical protein